MPLWGCAPSPSDPAGSPHWPFPLLPHPTFRSYGAVESRGVGICEIRATSCRWRASRHGRAESEGELSRRPTKWGRVDTGKWGPADRTYGRAPDSFEGYDSRGSKQSFKWHSQRAAGSRMRPKRRHSKADELLGFNADGGLSRSGSVVSSKETLGEQVEVKKSKLSLLKFSKLGRGKGGT